MAQGSFELQKIPGHEIYHFRFQKCVWLSMCFVRIQEFYESPDKIIRGSCNTLEDLIDRELGINGSWTYLTDWGGFNVPGHVWNHFFAKNTDVRNKEKDLADSLAEASPAPLFYVIGSAEDEYAEQVFQHEVRHALWYLYDEYRKPMLRLMDRFKTRALRNWLIREGYDFSVLDDEVQAYVLTGLEPGVTNTQEIKNLRRELKKIEKKFWPQVESV